jgi:hypothetical protein
MRGALFAFRNWLPGGQFRVEKVLQHGMLMARCPASLPRPPINPPKSRIITATASGCASVSSLPAPTR